MKIGLVGYQGCGKSALFSWLTGEEADPSLAHSTQAAMAAVHDPRVPQLCEIYQPKKITEAKIELVDTPGLDRGHDGNAARLAKIRDVNCMIQVVGAFSGADPAKELASFEEDMVLADLEIIAGRLERLADSIKRPRPDREELLAEQALLTRLQAHLEEGQPAAELEISADEEKSIRSFQLLSLKPRMALVNTADDEADLDQFKSIGGDELQVLAAPIGLESELAQMESDEAASFREEMGVGGFDRDALVSAIMEASGQMLFFTAGDKEVRTWLIPQNSTAVECADAIHSDLARGFIRAEVMTCADLTEHGSEREVKAAGLARNEAKDYVVRDGDVLNIKFSV